MRLRWLEAMTYPWLGTTLPAPSTCTFIPLSVIMFLAAIVWGLFTKIVFGRLADASTLVLATTAIQVFVIGMLAELINQRLPNAYDKD